MQYYGTRLSENISKREPEGYLLCLNVPVARTGTQEYLPEELGLAPGSFSMPENGMVSVYRPEEEVFAPETVASFEGMPVTNDHPPDGVDSENIRRLQTGHAHNVRRGSGEESDLLLADLIITDPGLIDAVLGGKREISCGYTYELSEEDGRYIQRKIRGNHIAVVDAGRAGRRVCIRDHKGTAGRPADRIHERRNYMKKSLSKILARIARDGDVETVAEFISEVIGEEAPDEAAPETAGEASTTAGGVKFVEAEASRNEQAPQSGAATVEAAGAEITIDEESLAGILERLDRLIALLTPAAADEEEDPAGGIGAEEVAEIVEEVIEAEEEAGNLPEAFPESEASEEVAEILETILEPEVSTTLEENREGDEGCGDPDEETAQDALRAALKAVRPALSRMSRRQRKRVCADIAARIRKQQRAADGYAALLRARKPGRPTDLGKRIMASRNANYHG